MLRAWPSFEPNWLWLEEANLDIHRVLMARNGCPTFGNLRCEVWLLQGPALAGHRPGPHEDVIHTRSLVISIDLETVATGETPALLQFEGGKTAPKNHEGDVFNAEKTWRRCYHFHEQS